MAEGFGDGRAGGSTAERPKDKHGCHLPRCMEMGEGKGEAPTSEIVSGEKGACGVALGGCPVPTVIPG